MDIPLLVREANAFPSFNPMQQQVLAKDWKNRNLLVCAPTASGKTIIAELLALESGLSLRQEVREGILPRLRHDRRMAKRHAPILLAPDH